MSFSQYSLWLRRSGLVIILFSRCLFDILSFFVRLVELISEFCSGSDVSSIFFILKLVPVILMKLLNVRLTKTQKTCHLKALPLDLRLA
jgi:hypothetical protein